MKKILALVFALIVAGHVNANPVESKSPVGMSVIKNGSLVKLFYQGDHSGKVRVKIYDQVGHIVFAETMQDVENFMRPYNFSSLPKGEYTIELTDDEGKRVRKISHDAKPKKRIAHLTRLRGNENKYLLAVPNDGRDALTVRIYGSTNKLLYQRTQVVDGDFAMVYNLDGIDGNHTFEVTDRDGKVNRLSKPRR